MYKPIQHYTPTYSTIHGYTVLYTAMRLALYTTIQHYTPLYSTIRPCAVIYTPI